MGIYQNIVFCPICQSLAKKDPALPSLVSICRIEVFHQVAAFGVEVVVQSALGHELLVVSPLHNALVFFHNQNGVGVFHGGEPVGDGNGGAAFGEGVQGMLDDHFAFVVQGRGGFVQNQDGRVFQENAGDGDPLFLSAGKLYAPLAHVGLKALFKIHDEVVGVGQLRRFHDFLVCGFRAAVANVFHDIGVKEVHVLLHHADAFSQAL